jgi:hypothetical protein
MEEVEERFYTISQLSEKKMTEKCKTLEKEGKLFFSEDVS